MSCRPATKEETIENLLEENLKLIEKIHTLNKQIKQATPPTEEEVCNVLNKFSKLNFIYNENTKEFYDPTTGFSAFQYLDIYETTIFDKKRYDLFAIVGNFYGTL